MPVAPRTRRLTCPPRTRSGPPPRKSKPPGPSTSGPRGRNGRRPPPRCPSCGRRNGSCRGLGRGERAAGCPRRSRRDEGAVGHDTILLPLPELTIGVVAGDEGAVGHDDGLDARLTAPDCFLEMPRSSSFAGGSILEPPMLTQASYPRSRPDARKIRLTRDFLGRSLFDIRQTPVRMLGWKRESQPRSPTPFVRRFKNAD